MFTRRIGQILLALSLVTIYEGVFAQDYPVRVVRFIVAGAAGGLSDILARIIADKLSLRLGHRVIVDNRPGAGGIVGTEIAARSSPDGYTINMGVAGSHAINVALRADRVRYDPIRDFVGITLVASAPNILVVHPSVPARSVKELIGLAKAHPGQLMYASTGTGFSQHLAGELFTKMADIKMVHVPYKGAVTGITDVVAGHVSVMFPNIPTALPQIKSARLRALAVTSINRSAVLPNMPTIAETGLPGYEATAWFGVFAPSGVSHGIVSRLNREVVTILKDSEVVEKMQSLGADPVGSTPQELLAHVEAEIKKWAKVIQDAGIKAD